MIYVTPAAAFDGYAQLLNQIGRAELPLAVRGTLNKAAFETRRQLSEVEMPKTFTLRNTFENKKSLHYQRCDNTFDIDAMQSSAGQKAEVDFETGLRKMEDLREQEVGDTLKARPGSKMMRQPTVASRIGKAFNRPVAGKNRPSKGVKWLKMRDIEQKAGLLDNPRGQPLSDDGRIKRAHAMMAKFKTNEIYELPLLGNRSVIGVFRIQAGKIVLLHKLETGSKKLKKRETVKPAMEAIVPQIGAYFEEQIDARIRKAAMRALRG